MNFTAGDCSNKVIFWEFTGEREPSLLISGQNKNKPQNLINVVPSKFYYLAFQKQLQKW